MVQAATKEELNQKAQVRTFGNPDNLSSHTGKYEVLLTNAYAMAISFEVIVGFALLLSEIASSKVIMMAQTYVCDLSAYIQTSQVGERSTECKKLDKLSTFLPLGRRRGYMRINVLFADRNGSYQFQIRPLGGIY